MYIFFSVYGTFLDFRWMCIEFLVCVCFGSRERWFVFGETEKLNRRRNGKRKNKFKLY